MSDKFFKQGVPVHDMMGSTTDRGFPGVVAGASALIELARKVANLANSDGDAGDVADIKDAVRQCVDVAQRLNTKVQLITPLVKEQ